MLRKNFVTIDLEAIRHNCALQQKLQGPEVALMAVVKADAYGHGMPEVAKTLFGMGIRHFAVALAEEGIQLRQLGIEGEILILGAATEAAVPEAIRWGLTQTVFTADMVARLQTEAEKQNRDAYVHIKLDTGMGRIGLRTEAEARAVNEALEKASRVKATGIYTHFAVADEPDPGNQLNAFTVKQLKKFEELRACFDPSLPAHAANSAMGLLRPDDFQMVRQGISLYGYPPVETELCFRPALRWATEVTHVKEVQPGDCIGYGCTFTAKKPMRIATVAVGYGDGYHRTASNRGCMLVHGKRAPIVGRVCMDQTMVDVTDIPGVVPGDEVVLIGAQGESFLSADEVAKAADTLNYEVLLAISLRVPKKFVGE